MKKINDTLIAEIKEMNNIKDAVSEYIKLESKGKHYVGLCPFHDEKTPSFTVYPDEYILKNDIEQFRVLLNNAISDIEYKLLNAMKDLNLENTYDKITYLTRAAEIISYCDDVLARDIYIGKLCDEYEVTRAALTEKVDEFRNKNSFDSTK